jgi:hypothetical protein
MNKYVLPTLVAGLMLMGIGMAMTSVDQASAVHATVQANSERHFVLTGTVFPNEAATDSVSWAIAQPFEVLAATTENIVDAGTNCNVNGVVIKTDLIPETGLTELDPAVANALNDSRNLIGMTVTDSSAIIGTALLEIVTDAEATCAATDSQEIQVVIKTTGALTTAPTGTVGAGAIAGRLQPGEAT